jgi:cold shock CspA family protein
MPAQRAAGEGQGVQGTVKSYNAAKGFGFIVSLKVQGDVYFKGEPDVSYEVGQELQFNLHYTPDGKAQARNVSPGLAEGQTVIGTVKSFNWAKGFGFISVPDQPADIHFRGEVVPEHLSGQPLEGKHVQIVAHLHHGKIQASQATFLASAPHGYVPPNLFSPSPQAVPVKRQFAATPPMQSARLQSFFGGAVPSAPPVKRQRTGVVPNGGMNGKLHGVIKSFNSAKGFGFIQSPSHHEDVYFMKKNLPIQQQMRTDLMGHNVTFSARMTPDGKMQAEAIAVLG